MSHEIGVAVRLLVQRRDGFRQRLAVFDPPLGADAFEVGHEIIRLLMAQANTQQAQKPPDTALQTDAGEDASLIGSQDRTVQTVSGDVSWAEPRAYLPQSRKAFFSSVQGIGTGH